MYVYITLNLHYGLFISPLSVIRYAVTGVRLRFTALYYTCVTLGKRKKGQLEDAVSV